MVHNKSLSGILADILIWVIILLMTLSCLLPLLNMIAVSFSDNASATANLVGIFPVNFTLSSYQAIINEMQFWRSFMISVLRVLLGLSINIPLLILTAYPISKSPKVFGAQKIYMRLVLFAMLFSGGLIPVFMVVNNLNLVNTIWALILPGAVPLGNVILLMNAFRGVPKTLEEASQIDGANQWQILFRIFLPVVKPTLAAVALFTIVGHWNDYFSALVYITKTANYPLQTYIQQLNVDITQVTNPEKLKELALTSSKTLNSAKIVVSVVPLMIIYPFLQRYFVAGIVVGSLKE